MILCIGDYIQDFYTFGTATRLCPESPVPVVVPTVSKLSAGGVGLVANQLQELGADVHVWRGSVSRKTRIFAGSHLITRIDEDSLTEYRDESGMKHHFEPAPFPDDLLRACECVVVSDYGKGAIFPEIAEELTNSGKPLFVDAKKSWHWYDGPNVTWFPNELEYVDACNSAREAKNSQYIQIVQKRGAHGCQWGEWEFPATVSDVCDTTGAGDIFLAAFVYANMVLRLIPSDCLQYANTLAGESCTHRGTYVVGQAYARSVLYTLAPSLMLGQPIPFEDYDSIGEEDPFQPGQFETLLASVLKKRDSQKLNLHADSKEIQEALRTGECVRIPHSQTLSPTAFDGGSPPSCWHPANPIGCEKTEEPLAQNPNDSERQRVSKLVQDLNQIAAPRKPQV